MVDIQKQQENDKGPIQSTFFFLSKYSKRNEYLLNVRPKWGKH